jgi:hypothetical protein
MYKLLLPTLIMLSILLYCPQFGNAQSAPGTFVPAEISADLGTCSALIAVTGADSKPVYAAKVNTRIKYGMFGVKKLDLEAYTGVDGKVKITNLPKVLKKPMYIHVIKGDDDEIVEFKPSEQCHAVFNVQVR